MAKLRINQGINLTLDASTTDFIVKSLSGPNGDLLLNGRNWSVEIRIDEDSSGGDNFRITKGSGGSTRLLTVENSGNLNIGGFDLKLGTSDQSTRGNTGVSRALVKDHNATLTINYAGDFTGGTRVDGPGLGVGGVNYVYNTNTSFQIPGANANAKWLIVKDTSSGAGVISFNNTKDADGNILGSLVWTREGGQSDGHRQVAGIVAVQSGTGAIAGSELRFYAKGTEGPVQAMVVNVSGASTPRVGIGISSPTERLETDGNIKASRFISTVSSGTSPFQVSSNTLVTNLNADLLDGYHASTTVTANTVAARDGSGNLSANAFVSTASTGTAPLQVSSTTKVNNLNADLLDGYDSYDFPRKAENATITGNWIFNGDLAIQQGKIISYGTFHKVMYPRWGFATNNINSANKWQKIGTFTATGNYSKIHIHAIIYGGRDTDDTYATQHLVVSLDTGGSTSIVTSSYVLGLYLEHIATSGSTNRAIKDVRVVIPDPTNYPNVAELWVQWDMPFCTVSPEVHIISRNFNYTINTDLTDDANAASTTAPSTGTVLVPNHSRISDLANRLATARTISLGGSLSGSTTFDGSSNVNINASINANAVGTTQLADGSVTYAKLAQDVRDAIAGLRIFQTTIGNETDSTYTVTHNFNTTNVEVSLTLLSTNEKIGAKVEVLNGNQIRVSFIAPIASNSVKVIVIG